MKAGTSELTSVGAVTDLGEDPLPIRPSEVHKAHASNVWVHRALVETPHSLHMGFAIPAEESKVRFVDLIEVQRQAGILQAHRQMGVPSDVVFSLDQISMKLVTRASRWDVPLGRGTIRAQIVATSVRGRARALAQHFSVESPFGLVAVGKARASLIPRAVYERVRGAAQAAQTVKILQPAPAGCYEGPLLVDSTDPLLSDHHSDHLTAMQMISGVERVALDRVPGASVRMLRLTFDRYVEPEPVPVLRFDVSGSAKFVADVSQAGIRCARVAGALTSPGVR